MSTELLDGLDAPESELTDTPEPEAPVVEQEAKVEAPKPDAKAPAKIEPKDEPKTIPLAAHLEERNKHRSELEQLRKEQQTLREQLAALQNPPKAKPAEPDFTADPKGYVDHTVKAVLDKLETGTAESKQTAEQAKNEAAQARFFQMLDQTQQQFVSQTPDYYAALEHLRSLRAQEILTLEPEIPQEKLKEILQHEELNLAAQLMRAGRNPHQVAYQLAKARGYAPKAALPAGDVLPKVPGPKTLPPDQTLGSGSGTPDSSGETFLEDDQVFDKAFNEVFGRKRA
jgi:hypothetical protein